MSDKSTVIGGLLVNIDDMTDQQLEAFIAARKRKREEEARKPHQLYVDTLKDIGHYILPLMEHGRTSCGSYFNGAFNDDQPARCSKCGLEAIINGDEELPLGIKLVIRFEKV